MSRPPATPVMFQRQMGYLGAEEQQRLAQASVAVLGLGGVGGVCAELLVRAGVGHLLLGDGDRFEPTNLNRQIGATGETMGQAKEAVTAARLALINPQARLAIIPPLGGHGWRPDLLAGRDAVILAADAPRAALMALRAARRGHAPLVEAVALPTIQIRAFDPQGPDPEDGMATQGRPLSDFSDEALSQAMAQSPLAAWLEGDGSPLALSPAMLLAMAQGHSALSFGPHVWLAGALAALECLKIILGRGVVAWHPGRAALDPCLWRLFLAE